MTIKSLNISLPFEIEYNGRTVKTGIYKRPVAERLNLEKLNIKGDGQADLSVHGGEFKAVYSYAREHYAYWQTELDRVLDWGMFGENLTTEGLDESQVFLGNQYQVGTCVLEAVQPRMPCFKLGIRFEDNSIIKKFQKSGRNGIYYRVVTEGDLQVGDTIELVKTAADKVPVDLVADAYYGRAQKDDVKRLLDNQALSPNWREYFQERQ